MAIYGRFGDEVTIVRVGTLDDVKTLDGRTPDKQDRDAVAAGSYVVTQSACTCGAPFREPEKHTAECGYRDGERLHHLAFMRADDGIREIMDAVRALETVKA